LLNVMPRLQPFFLLLPDRQPDVIAFAHLLFEVSVSFPHAILASRDH
jgi:hypothetical protein